MAHLFVWRKAVVLLLAFAFVLAACSGGRTDSANNHEEDGSTAESTATEGTSAMESDTSPHIAFPFTGPERTFSAYFADLGANPDTEARKHFLQMLGNVRFDWSLTPWSDYEQQLNIMLSSNELTDFIIASNVMSISDNFGATGVLLDFNQYLDHMPNLRKFAEQYPFVNNTVTDDGKRFVIHTLEFEDRVMQGWFYNKTLLDKHQIQVPETRDEFVAAMNKIKEAAPGVTPFLNRYNLTALVAAMENFYPTSDDGLEFNSATGKWYYGPFDDNGRFKDMLQFMNLLWEQQLLHPEVLTQSEEQVLAEFESGNWAFTFDYDQLWHSALFSRGVNLDYEFKPMATPKHNGQAYLMVTVPFDAMPHWGQIASAHVEQPELLAATLDYMFSDEMAAFRAFGVEGLTYRTNADGSRELLPEVKTLSNPEGTIDAAALGFTGAYDNLATVFNWNAYKQFNYDPIAMESTQFQMKAIGSGRVTAKYGDQPRPALTTEEANEVSEVMSPIQTFVEESRTKFILGDTSFAEWDEFLAQIERIGDVQKVVDLLNSKPQFVRAERDESGLKAKIVR